MSQPPTHSPQSRDTCTFAGSYETQELFREEADRLIDAFSSKAFSSVHCIVNPVFNRNPYVSPLLTLLLTKRNKPTRLRLFGMFARNILLYFIRSARYCIFFMFQIIRYRSYSNSIKKELLATSKPIFVDTFIICDKVSEEGKYEERYLLQLFPFLETGNRPIYTVPCFIGDKNEPQIFRFLTNPKRGLPTPIPDFALLDWLDFIRLLSFTLTYPIRILSLIFLCVGQNRPWQIAYSLLYTLKIPTADSFIRYLYGKNLAKFTEGEIDVLSWYENQPIDKAFYAGLRTTGRNKVKITGIQALAYSRVQANYFATLSEYKHGLLPDHLRVNGTAYLKWHNHQLYQSVSCSPSFRYQHLRIGEKFSIAEFPEDGAPLIALTYFKDLSLDLLGICRDTYLASESARVRLHPTQTGGTQVTWQNAFPSGWMIDSLPLPQSLMQATVLITKESGIALEAATVGIPVVIIASNQSFTSNPMPNFGRNDTWGLAHDSRELEALCKKLIFKRVSNPSLFRIFADRCRRQLFTPINDETLQEAFGHVV